MKKFSQKLLLLCACVFLSPATTFSQGINTAKLDSFFDVLSINDKAMGSITISANNKIVYSKTIGFRHAVDGNPVFSNDSTKYRIGSITKMFTAAMIFQLIDEKKLSLDSLLVNYFPDIPNSHIITIRDLLQHRSGIYDFTKDSTYHSWKGSPKSHEDILKILYSKLPEFPPAVKTEYSNSNYVLLGYILEAIESKDYSVILNDRITSKIGLKNTYYGGKIDTKKNEANSFFYSFGWYQHPETDMSNQHGSGAVVSNSSDLVLFIEALFNEKLISSSGLYFMTAQVDGFGMGMVQFPYGKRKAYGHSGSIDGFSSNLAYFPDEKLAISYVSNGLVYPINDLMIGVLSICFNDPYKIPDFKTVKLDKEELNKYTGLYTIQDAPFSLNIFISEDKLFAQATGQNPLPLTAVEKDKFVFEQASLILEFNLSKKELTLNQGGQLFLFTRKE